MELKKIQRYVRKADKLLLANKCDSLACCLSLALVVLGLPSSLEKQNTFLDLRWTLSVNCHPRNVENILDGGA